MTFNQLLGLEITERHDDGVTIECAVRPDLMNGMGVLHGGVTATVADAAMGIGLSHVLGKDRAITTVEMKINYMHPVVSGKVVARSYVLRIGTTLSTGRVDLFDGEGTPVGVALLTYMLLSKPT
ncbi:MAG: PaaI family thioesterase [Bryobacterales bacterium]